MENISKFDETMNDSLVITLEDLDLDLNDAMEENNKEEFIRCLTLKQMFYEKD